MKWEKIDAFILSLLGLSLILFFWIYPSLPAELPLRWNLNFEVSNMGPKSSYILLALLGPILWIFFHYLPHIAPKGHNYRKNVKSWKMILTFTVMLFQIILWVSVAKAKGMPVQMRHVFFLSFGIFSVVVGNFMGKIQHNYFIGIRTPWTLASEENWKKTHRFAGKTVTISGLIMILSLWLWPHSMFPVVALSVGYGLPVLYSIYYFVKHKEEM